jgi:ABC-2 type transport system ATP-binding protein
MQTVIKVANLRKSYKSLEVLKGVSFEIYKGKIFALLGSNGAGKTTCVRILSTLLSANGGEATICGHDVFKAPDKVRGVISLTGQYAAVDEVLTGRENLELIGRLKHLPNYKQEAQTLLEKFNLVDAGGRPALEYSGGMRRRLDIAMSMMGSPQVIFLDEPTTGLDPQNRLAMWELIDNLAKAGTTILLTTQYLEEAEHLADHIAILHEGVITAEGTPDELKKLLPVGEIHLDFATEEEKNRAAEVLADLNPKQQRKSIEIATDGSVGRLAQTLNRLHSENIRVARLTQNQPTLEDAFLTLIGEKKGADNNE